MENRGRWRGLRGGLKRLKELDDKKDTKLKCHLMKMKNHLDNNKVFYLWWKYNLIFLKIVSYALKK